MKKTMVPLVLVTLGLALLDIWCDVLGHGSAMVASADLVQQSFTNGRVFWNLSLVFFCAIMVLAPQWFTSRQRRWDTVIPLVAVAGTLAYGFAFSLEPSGILSTTCIIVTGVCYGWLEARLFCEAARLSRLPGVVTALAGSRAIKVVVAAVVGAADVGMQIGLDALAVVGCGMCLIAASVVSGTPNAEPSPVSWKLSKADRGAFVAFVVLFPVLNAVARALSPLGFWGDESIVGTGGIVLAVPAATVFIGLVALIFWRCDNKTMFRRLACALLVLLAALLLVDEGTLASLGVSEAVVRCAILAVELFSHFLFWLAAVMAVRSLEWSPLRSAAMAELVMSFAAIVFSLVLQTVSGMGRLIVIFALYGVVLALMVVVWRAREQLIDREIAGRTVATAELGEACAFLAKEHGLSPRESEVLELLAEGRSRPYIMDKLTISDATVKSHTNHVYQKLGVHSKQELIALVRDR